MSLTAGEQLGTFEITGLLGRGGMGEVYSARDRKLGRDVAIKMLPEYFAADAERLARFEREAQTLAALNHNNVATVHGFEHDDGRGLHYLVMEHIDGDTLGERIEAGPLSVSALLPIFIDIARGLDAAHEAGIVHRDLKPDNVKINGSGVVKILDFGLAKGDLQTGPTTPDAPTTPIRPLAVTAEGTFLGTPSYMSPEQARGKEVDRRTDIWAFGCCLYQVLTGDIPFKGDTIADTVGAILERNPDWSKLPKDTPREIRSLLRRCLEKDPRKRFSSAGDMAYILEEYRDHLRQEVHRPSGIQTPAPAPRRVAWLPLVAGVVLAIVGLCATLWAIQRSNQTPGPGVTNERPAIASLAVLPLENLMKDPEQDYFADGMTDALIGELGKISSLDKVISRTTAVQYRDTDKSMRQIADELGVQGIIEGSVLRENDQVSIRLRLFDASTEHQIWQHDYEENVESVLKLNGDIALAVASAIDAKLSGAEQTRLSSHETVVPAAYDAYLRGKAAAYTITDKGFAEASRWFDEAVRLDPEFASAYAWSGLSLWAKTVWFGGASKQAFEKAKNAAAEALRLNDESVDAHAAMAYVAMVYDDDWQSAMQHARRAVEIAPQDAGAHNALSTVLIASGHLPGGLQEARKAVELDPSNVLFVGDLMLAYRFTRRFDEALEVCDTWRARHGDASFILSQEAWALRDQGELEHALETLAIREQLDGSKDPQGFQISIEALHGLGRTEEADRMLAEFLQRYGNDPGSQVRFGELYLALGQLDEGFKRYNRAYEERNFDMVWLRFGNMPEAFYNDPRYWDLVERMHFPPLPPEHPLYAKEQKWKIKQAAKQMLAEQGVDGAAKIDSIVVLPLENLMKDPEQDYFVDGMTEAITAELSKISSLKVISRTSAMHYKNTDLRAPEIAAELKVQGLVEGSVMREDDEVRITVQLIDGPEDRHLWSESYMKPVTSVLKLQAEVALAIAGEIRATVEPDEQQRIATKGDVKPGALEAYLYGRQLIQLRTKDDIEQAIEQFQRAIKIDDTWAPPFSGVADAHIILGFYAFEPKGESFAKGKEAAQQAIALDPSLAEAYTSFGYSLMLSSGDWDGARKACEKALTLDPNYAEGLHWYGVLLWTMGRNKEARQMFERALEMDPHSLIIRLNVAGCSFFEGDLNGSLTGIEKLLEQAPDFQPALVFCFLNLEAVGKYEQALAIARKLRTLRNNDNESTDYLAAALVHVGRPDEAKSLVDGYPDSDLQFWINYHLALGDVDRCLAILRKYVQTGVFPPFIEVSPSPVLDPLRSDDRFWEFLEECHYPLVPSDHPVYKQQQEYLARKAAKEMLAEQSAATPKPIRHYAINLPTANAMPGDGLVDLSPDGSTLAYALADYSKVNLFTYSIREGKGDSLNGINSAWYKFFSPDGKRLAFFDDLGGALKTIDLKSREIRTLADAPDNWGGTWGPDDTIVYAPDMASGLWRIPATGGTPVQVTEPDTKHDESHRSPHFLPDGRHVLFNIRVGPRTEDSRVALLDLDSGEVTPLVDRAQDARYVPSGHIVFARDGNIWAAPFDLKTCNLLDTPKLVLNGVQMDGPHGLACYAFSQTGTLVYQESEQAPNALLWIDRDGKEEEALPDKRRRPYYRAQLSPDGMRVAALEGGPTSRDVWVIDLTRGTRTRIPGAGNTSRPVWAPDGNSLILSSDQTGTDNMYSARADGSTALEPILPNPLNDNPVCVARDGTIFFHERNPGEGLNIWYLTPGADTQPTPFLTGPASYYESKLHPGGSWLAYGSDVSGQGEVYVTSFPERGTQKVISVDGGAYPRWSRDGNELFYVEGDKLMSVDIAIDGDTLTAGVPTPLFEKDFGNTYGFQDVDTDGQRFLVIKSLSDTTELSVIENWFEELKRLAPVPEGH